MKFKTRIVFTLLILAVFLQGSSQKVHSIQELQNAINSATPGDEIILANGIYNTTSEIDIYNIQGNENNWITIRAESTGGAEISGESSFKINQSAYIKVEGFYITQNVESKCFAIRGSENIRVTNCSFDLEEDGTKSYWLYVSGSPCPQNIRIDHNDFAPKYDEGCFIVVYGPSDDIAKYVTIDHNHFQGHYFEGSNGGEAIRYGDSNRQNYSSYAVIEENLFEYCDGDPEVISVKSTNLTVRRNTLRECNGSIVLRHGDSCIVESNFILNGDGGIRFYGDNQRIVGNYLYNNDNIKPSGENSTVRGAICVGGGKQEDLANGEKTYDQPNNCIVAFNTLCYNRGENIDIGVMGNDSYPPKNLTIANNIIVSDEEECVHIRKEPDGAEYFSNILYGNAQPGDIPDGGYNWIAPDMEIDDYGVYHINQTSPAVDNSQTIPELAKYSTDIDGQNRSNYDIGADEYSNENIIYRPLDKSDVGVVRDRIYCTTTEEIQEALQTAQPRDNIVIAPGTFTSDGSNSGSSKASFFGYADGTPSAPITLSSEDTTNRAVLSGTTLEHKYVLYITGDHWNISGLDLKNGQKGLILDNADHTYVTNVNVHEIGTEGIHIRDGSSYCVIDRCHVYNTGRVRPGIGEGIYVGSAVNHWDKFEKTHTDVVINNCTLGPNVTAEHVDIKEGTVGTIVKNCHLDGTGISGEHYADSFMDVKGNYSIIRNNIGYRNDNGNIVDAFQTHEKVNVWGFNNYFYNNELYLNHGSVNIVDASSGSALVSENIHHPGGTLYSGQVTEYDNLPPMISITSPADGKRFVEGEYITLSAEGFDVDGNISRVVFFANGTEIGDSEYEPYQYLWRDVPADDYKLTAKVIDNEGFEKLSDPINIMVNTPRENEYQIAISEDDITASTDDGNIAANTIDKDLNTRWSAEGDGNWIQYDLAQFYWISFVKIAFYKGDQRVAYFDLQVSDDGESWTTVLSDAASSGTTSELQTFNFENITAKYVRYVGHGNSENDWNSLLEFEIWGKDPVLVDSLAPMDDTYIRDGEYSGDNYGMEEELLLSTGNNQSDNSDIIMKYKIPKLEGNINEAILKLTPTDADISNNQISMELYEITDNNWFELGLNWDNAPTMDSLIMKETKTVNLSSPIEFDLTDYIDNNKDREYISLGFNISNSESTTESIKFASKNHNDENLHPSFTIVSELGTNSVEDKDSESPALITNYALEQNYPNPFNSSTNIGFQLKSDGFTTLKVYDMLGRKVETIVEQGLEAGSYNFIFNASNLPSGVYFYRIKSDNFTDVKKMLLVK